MNVQTPDGVAQFPDDMSQDEISAVLRKQYGTQDTKEPTSPLSPGRPFGDSLVSYHPEEAIWNKPADESWAHFITKRPAVSALISALNNATLGGLDMLTGGAGTAAQERTAGTPFYATGAIGGAAGLGAAGEALGAGRAVSEWVAPKIAPLVGEKAAPWIGNRVGGAVEQGGLGLIGAGIQGQDPTQAGLISGGIGAITGPFGRLFGAGAGPTAAELGGATKTAYKPLDDTVVGNVDFNTPVQKAWSALKTSGGDLSATQKAAKSTKAIVKDIASNKEMTFGELDDMSQRLGKAAQRGTLEDQQLAPIIKRAVDDFIDTGTGWNRAAGAATAPGEMGAARQVGKIASGREKDAEWLAEAQTKAGLPGGPGVGPQAQSRLLSEEGQRFAPEGSPARDAMTALAKIPGPGGNLAPTTFDLHRIAHPIAYGMGGALFGGHEDLGSTLQSVGRGLAIGYGAKAAAKYLNPRAWDQVATQAAARKTLTTGVPWDRFYARPSQKLVDALRAINAAYGPRGGF